MQILLGIYLTTSVFFLGNLKRYILRLPWVVTGIRVPPMWNRVDSNTTPDVSKTVIANYGEFIIPEYN